MAKNEKGNRTKYCNQFHEAGCAQRLYTKKSLNPVYMLKKKWYFCIRLDGEKHNMYLAHILLKEPRTARDCSVIGSSVRLTNTSEGDSLTRVRATH